MRFEGIPEAKGKHTKVCFQHSAGIIRLLDFNSLNQLRPLIPKEGANKQFFSADSVISFLHV
jgi:hypothetical protein